MEKNGNQFKRKRNGKVYNKKNIWKLIFIQNVINHRVIYASFFVDIWKINGQVRNLFKKNHVKSIHCVIYRN